PPTMSVKPGSPANAVLGDSDINIGVVGGAGLIEKSSGLDSALPGLLAVTSAIPKFTMSPAGIVTSSWVALTNVVGRGAPLQRPLAPLTKLLPVTVSVKLGPPAEALFGVSAVSKGAAATGGGAGVDVGVAASLAASAATD